MVAALPPLGVPHNFYGRLQIGVRFRPIIELEATSGTYSKAELMPRSKGRRGPKIPASQTRPIGAPQSHTAAGPPHPSLGYDPNRPMEQKSIVRMKDGWSEYELDDGTVLKTRTAIVDVKRAVGQYSPIQAASVINTEAPEHLKKT
jgi:hypothetical protein